LLLWKRRSAKGANPADGHCNCGHKAGRRFEEQHTRKKIVTTHERRKASHPGQLLWQPRIRGAPLADAQRPCGAGGGCKRPSVRSASTSWEGPGWALSGQRMARRLAAACRQDQGQPEPSRPANSGMQRQTPCFHAAPNRRSKGCGGARRAAAAVRHWRRTAGRRGSRSGGRGWASACDNDRTAPGSGGRPASAAAKRSVGRAGAPQPPRSLGVSCLPPPPRISRPGGRAASRGSALYPFFSRLKPLALHQS
jgi:hypothetical protein